MTRLSPLSISTSSRDVFVKKTILTCRNSKSREKPSYVTAPLNRSKQIQNQRTASPYSTTLPFVHGEQTNVTSPERTWTGTVINMFTERGQTDLKPSTATSSCSSLHSQYEPISRLYLWHTNSKKKTQTNSHDVKVNAPKGAGDSLRADGQCRVVLGVGVITQRLLRLAGQR